MTADKRLVSDRFPRASAYNPDWVLASVSGGANPLWLTEWLCEALELRPGMRVLDLGCGRAMSSIFLRREFGVQVWATDLWFNVSENLQRIRDAGVEDGVFPIHANARELPFAAEFFDAIVSIDSFFYYGTDDMYLNDFARFVKPGGTIGIAQAGLTNEMDGPIPAHLRAWWAQDQPWCFHSAAWWRRHWEGPGFWTWRSPTRCPTAGVAGWTGCGSSHPKTRPRSRRSKPTRGRTLATFELSVDVAPTAPPCTSRSCRSLYNIRGSR
jgi:ubiquinone/menaquinone biosynthesis C-methylase UbiE